MAHKNIFGITRVDLDIDPVVIRADYLAIGSRAEHELALSHPSVAPIHAIIIQEGPNFTLRKWDAEKIVKLNDIPVDEQLHRIVPGDAIGIGVFELKVAVKDGVLALEVSRQFTDDDDDDDAVQTVLAPEEVPAPTQPPAGTSQPVTEQKAPAVESGAHVKKAAALREPAEKHGLVDTTSPLSVFLARVDDKTKMAARSLLNPFLKAVKDGERYRWKPTSDLTSGRWVSVLTWLLGSLFAVGLLVAITSMTWPAFFSPGPLAEAHAGKQLTVTNSFANRPNSNQCLTCHSARTTAGMEANCAACHHTDTFEPTITDSHRRAGIGCLACHKEHLGVGFQSANAALLSCSECHNDNNKQSYYGKTVSTPHHGGLGYPVREGKWIWKGPENAELVSKSIPLDRKPAQPENEWRKNQFYRLHGDRVLGISELPARDGKLSCSSCHKQRDPIDLETPRQTCGWCHGANPSRALALQPMPVIAINCNSCHPQHFKDDHRRHPLLVKS